INPLSPPITPPNDPKKLEPKPSLKDEIKGIQYGLDEKDEPRHFQFRKDIEANYKGKSGYVCKTYKNGVYCGCVIRGKLPEKFNLPIPDMDCAENFWKIATMAMCGNGYFDQMKLCALTNFFDDQKPENVPKDNRHKKMLVLLDGCATCSGGGTITGLRITHLEEAGGFFSKCDEMKEFEAFSVSDLSINIPASNKVDGNSATFTIPAILTHRVCNNIFYENIAKDNYVNVKLHIDYMCGGNKAKKVIDLPSIDLKSFKNRIAEIRGLWINLDGGDTKQYVREGLDFKIDDKMAGSWTDPNLDCWTKNEICKLK
uniref:Uncharacterized protein n=1 Tax=Meloidogyne javanica TaxID=6303 RepID=A0A915N6V9_MELJA